MLREPQEGKPPRAIEVPLEEAKVLLADAAALNLSTRTGYPPGAEEALRHFGITPAARTADIPVPADADAGLAAQGAALHDEPEIRAWLPPVEALRALALKQQEIATSQLYINEAQRREQLAHQTRLSAEGFFTPQVRRLYAQRLWTMGEFLDRTDRRHAAQVAFAESKRLFHQAPGLSAFSMKLFDKVVELSRQLQRGEELPGPEPATTSGGLILP
jgi:hypothetical protein